jgi:hypothetical protein
MLGECHRQPVELRLDVRELRVVGTTRPVHLVDAVRCGTVEEVRRERLRGIHPAPDADRGQSLVSIQVEIGPRRIQRRMRAVERQVQEERTGRVATPQEVDRLSHHPARRVQHLVLRPRTRHVAVAAEPQVDRVGAHAEPLAQPDEVIVVARVVARTVAHDVEVAVV